MLLFLRDITFVLVTQAKSVTSYGLLFSLNKPEEFNGTLPNSNQKNVLKNVPITVLQ